jgi:thiol-disulfide isomerase/thioredoxin
MAGAPRRLPVPARVGIALAALIAAFATASMTAPVAGAAADPRAEPVVVEVFWGDGCGYCEALLDDLAELSTRLAGFDVVTYEVWRNPANRALMEQRAAALGVRAEAVPFTIVDGTQSWLGYTAAIGRQIEAAIVAALGGTPTTADPPGDTPAETVIDVPLLGEVDVQGRSLALTTVFIALVDGFNPCSLWVLTVLLALVLHTGSRRRVAFIGGTFLVVTTLIYGLFIVGIYSALSFVGALGWIRGVVAVFALTFGLVNVKDYLWFKVGPSLTIADEHKPGIFRQARGLVRPGISLPAAMVGAGVMAAGVALVEIPCTAGFPVIWSDLVNAAGASRATFAVLLALYLLIYLFDELLVFGAAVVTMRVTKLQERHGRVLKLVGGMVMITIAVTILVAPEAMDSPTGVLRVFGAALAASALVAAIDRIVRKTGDRAPVDA